MSTNDGAEELGTLDRPADDVSPDGRKVHVTEAVATAQAVESFGAGPGVSANPMPQKLAVDPALALSMSVQDDEQIDELGEKISAFKSLVTGSPETADAVFDKFDIEGETETDIATEMVAPLTIAHPGEFEAAHRMAVKSLEVLKRNGYRPVNPKRKLPIVTPLMVVGIQLISRFIVENHLRLLTEQVYNLYSRREAWAVPRSDNARMLRQARLDMEMIKPGFFKDSPFGLPTFLLGGAVVSSIAGALGAAARTISESQILIAVTTILSLVIILGGAWTVLRGTAVARKRIRLTTDQPMNNLYRVIGNCGQPPQDQSKIFALIAMLLMLLAWVVIPLGIFAIVGRAS